MRMKIHHFITLLIIFFISHRILCIPIDNGVQGDPKITCGIDAISADIDTRNEFKGNIFVKGRYGDQRCTVKATNTRKISIKIPHTDCGTQRIRSLNPAGLQISITIVVSFHPSFLTKVDKVYAISCFYMEAIKNVNAELDVSAGPEVTVTQTVPMPICKYEVLRGGPNGQPVKYASVGEPVYHRWTCDTDREGLFCMLVHSCQVTDSEGGNRYQLIDDHGCSIDKYLLQQIDYFGELSAGRESHVFRFADKPAVFFQCQLSLTIRERAGQPCPTPNCGNLQSTYKSQFKKVRRNVETWLKEQYQNASFGSVRTLDTITRRINILDLDDSDLSDLPSGSCPNYPPSPLKGRPLNGGGMIVEVDRAGPGKVCLSTAAFTIVVTATLVVAISTIVILAIALYRTSLRNLFRNLNS